MVLGIQAKYAMERNGGTLHNNVKMSKSYEKRMEKIRS